MTFFVNDDDRIWQEPQKTSWFHFPNPLRYVILLIILMGLLVGVWYLVPFSSQPVQKEQLPLVRADETPFKIKSEDQGVPGVSHQDKLVYGRIRNDQTDPPVEHILPDPAPPLLLGGNATAPIKMVDQYTPEDIDLEPVEYIPPAPAPQPSHSIDSIEALIEEATPVEEEKLPTLSKQGKAVIQLGSLKSHDLAESEWSRLSKKHKDVLGALSPTIQKVDLGQEQGTYYRLRTSLEDEEHAKTACATLQDRKVSCLVIH